MGRDTAADVRDGLIGWGLGRVIFFQDGVVWIVEWDQEIATYYANFRPVRGGQASKSRVRISHRVVSGRACFCMVAMATSMGKSQR